jgi:DNA-binding winged helix-turn-helix (wHTH) protein/TolB-like protein/Flp pilus assembly protein TadD
MTQAIYVFGDYRLDAARRLLARRDGVPIPITSRVFDTLLHLVANAGRLVDKRELMAAVWGDTVVEENNLTQAISTLRQLLGERPDEHRYVVTVSGRGYRFIAEVRTAEAGDRPDERPALAVPAAQPVPVVPGGGSWRRWQLGAGVALLVIVAAIAWLSWRPGGFGAGHDIETVAILPFKPVVAEAGDPALELGMADTLIARLSRNTGLVVRPLSSVRKYTELDQDPVAAGRELGVDAVLEGSVHRDGNALRVTARLVRVKDGAALWADQIDQSWTDVFRVQDLIADRVASALALQLTSEERARLARSDTESGEAYRLYLLGRYHFLKLIPPEIIKGISYFEQAVAEDPGYARAYAGLAEAYRALAITSDRRPAEVLPIGKSAALKAIELDASLESAFASLCFIQVWWDWDWQGAEQSCRQALALDPDSADGHRAYAVLLSDLGRHDEAIAEARRAVELEPLALITRAIEGHVLLYAGRTDEALERLRAALDLEPQFWIARLFIGKAHLARGEFPEALAEFEMANKFSGGNSETLSLTGYTRARMNDRKGAQRALEELLAREPARYVPPFNVAMIHHGLGDRDETFRWLEKAYAERDVRLTFLKVERKWDPIRSDARFVALAQRVGLD